MCIKLPTHGDYQFNKINGLGVKSDRLLERRLPIPTLSWCGSGRAHRFELTRALRQRHIRVAPKQELKDRIMATMYYFNQELVVHIWAYKLDKAMLI